MGLHASGAVEARISPAVYCLMVSHALDLSFPCFFFVLLGIIIIHPLADIGALKYVRNPLSAEIRNVILSGITRLQHSS